jgi:hypothetical protein
MKRLIVNCETGENTYVDLTDAEISEMQAQNVLFQEKIAQHNLEVAEEIAARESARTKLAALGLTEAEVAALVK